MREYIYNYFRNVRYSAIVEEWYILKSAKPTYVKTLFVNGTSKTFIGYLPPGVKYPC